MSVDGGRSWLAEGHIALETVLYSIVGIGVVSGVTVVAVILRREFGRVPARPALHRLSAPIRPTSVAKPRPVISATAEPVHQVVIISQPPAIVHQHVAFPGVTAADLAAIIARQRGEYGPAIEEEK